MQQLESNRNGASLRWRRVLQLFSPLFCVLFSVVCLSSCALLTPPPDDTKGVRDWLVVPVFYATNRTMKGEPGSLDYSEVPNGKGLLFGVKNIAVPVPIYSPLEPDTVARMQWQQIHEDPTSKAAVPVFDGEKCLIKDSPLERDEVVHRFHSYMKTSHSKEIVIFVHGCCATFNTTMKRAARLSAHMKVPVVVYDWVSPKGFTKYLANETMAGQSYDNFCRFLNNTEKVVSAGNISLLGHSMGALILDEAMVRRAAQSQTSSVNPPLFNELIMSNADVDAKTFLNHASLFDANASKTRIYFSTADSRLNASAIAHGGFNRLGEPGALIGDLCKDGKQELIDITANNTGHELPYWIVANFHNFGGLGQVKEFVSKSEAPNLFKVMRIGVPSPEAVKSSSDDPGD